MIHAVDEHHNNFSHSQGTVQEEGEDHDKTNILLLMFVKGYSKSHKTTEPELFMPGTLIESQF
jgi:hypothetical protein